jgi:hypothetical protein
MIPASLLAALLVWCQAGAPLSNEQKEEFLKTAKVVKTSGTRLGITGVIRATLSDGNITHEAAIQSIDQYAASYQTLRGTELNFKDSYKFNIAAYRLNLMLGLDMVPPTIDRKHGGKSSSFCWWVDDVLMDEMERTKKKLEPPDPEMWNKQMWIVRVFDQLIFNTDRNLGNLIIDKNWKIWMIDHTRAFRTHSELKEAKNLDKCEKNLLAKLKELNEPALKKEVGQWLTNAEISGLLKRRDKIVKFFEEKGPSAIYELNGPKS